MRAGPLRALLPVLLLAVSACASVTPIGELLDDPARYDGREVRIEGEVTASAGALGLGAYTVDDGTGTLPVVSETRGSPREGARVRVKGLFEALFTLGANSLAVLREVDREVRH
jgi:hypothetical protein